MRWYDSTEGEMTTSEGWNPSKTLACNRGNMIYQLIKETIFFLIIINPMSKIVIVSMLSKQYKHMEVEKLLVKSSIIAMIMLVIFAFAGEIILRDLFHISTNALMIAGGIVLSFMGFTALNKGVFFQAQNSQSLMDLAIVPLASPLIAGPATITATIVKATTLTPHFVSLSVIIAVLINLMIVSFSLNITGFLNKYNLTGALIRITGLFILAMGVDMALKGIKSYF